MARANNSPSTAALICHVAAMAREFHELTATAEMLEQKARERPSSSEVESELERLDERLGEAQSRIQIAASYSAATSTEGALFQLGQMKSMAAMIGNRGPKCPWESDASIAHAIERLGYSVANCIGTSQDLRDSDTLAYFFPLDCDPHRTNESVKAGMKNPR